ncbi:MAG: hypothetical protein US83_C0006G0059 [Candidatus Falkowbacteria bacterium GW2011_GWC2_38_22]|uniref:ATPase AAA-type core domain-containing protein n=1 Tax=Candidatus Falkowbacteria bacterium GW2011_GWE1_38_31 TaxID=1618638 RepID=A0A0G0JX24_9BACT|nr:MAG: hypothetical protein US73_C0001G0029 [Candidatus Falkowbacteria bacterium GW2011_GWF2_38_1205]KKQ61419.1 MAG: hypothetical protein US83_C0006G0059 [Candidatus Falkowbacteria bacterium GW2011_GWC2_38_22]KKQ63997.1 MAG: hypothetical protein US84_C0002G0029 [Candidatus Falkowbacteria bacterium GW2011_GWF1_38_22]KKQ66655.1 MAG: hypothetical protein US87_C0001G0176 [Candidatus Falkowbacteria bacterium GW2011_GWE2_38_254]KKQ71102.1 MAG: hypothetical protein US91_C0001G0029 [Candidatus Falkowb
MPKTAENFLPIDESVLASYNDGANAIIDTVRWMIKKDPYANTKTFSAAGYRNDLLGGTQAKEDTVSLVKTALKHGNGSIILPNSINHCLQTIWQGLRIGQYLTDLYVKASNLDNLQKYNDKNQLTPQQKTEFCEKNETAAAIFLFTSASFIVYDTNQYRGEELVDRNIDMPVIPEFSLSSFILAKRCFIYYLTACLDRSGLVHDEVDFLKLTMLYCQSTVNEILSRVAALRHSEAFVSKNYKLDKSEFIINGFEPLVNVSGPKIEFNKVKAEDIVGNADAKHKARRLVERILCYDKEKKANPMRDMGGLAILRAGFGIPGTGKGMHISYVATLLQERCEVLTGLTFYYNPMPLNLVSTYQGGSAERAIDWMRHFKNPNHICYGPIDDAEQNFQERTRPGVSAGVHEIINTFLPTVEGPNAIWYGNTVMELFTNLPEIIDKAVLSRVQEKFAIDGAKTWADFLDQDHLWWRKLQKLEPGFLDDLKDPENYVYLSAQKLVASIAETMTNGDEPTHEALKEIYCKAKKVYDEKNHGFFAEVYHLTKERYPGFSSRDARNIQRAVDERLLDFDFPEEWMNDPKLFYRKGYDEKKSLIVEMMKNNMHGLKFREIRNQELIRYIETWLRIQETGMERAVEEAAKRCEIDFLGRERATKRLKREE